MEILSWIIKNRKMLFKTICAASVAFCIWFGASLYKENKMLSERLEMAQNNVEAYQGLLEDSQQANNVLKLDMEQLREANDKVLREVDSVRQELKIKAKEIEFAATQKQVFCVIQSKGVRGDLVEILKDTVYNDSIKYNDLTTVKYTIGKDTVSVGLDVQNTQYLYVYSHKEYKNKKNFLQRLFTWDWKKVRKYKYNIVNTNDLLKTSDVRVIESEE